MWKQGAAIHWLHKKSKRPIESGWTTGPRKDWTYLDETYIEDLNVGVRLGTPSKIKGAFLAVVDVDVKSTDKRHRLEALAAAKSVLGKSYELCPVVTSGRGNGSRHFYVLTKEPFKTWNPAVSEEQVKVFMPSKKPSKAELSSLTEKEIANGTRIANAWEISLYSDGRQVVLPPSIHPDSGKPYVWKKLWTSVDDLPVVQFPTPAAAPSGETDVGTVKRLRADDAVNDVAFTKVDLGWLPISDKVRDAILNGKGVEDRSGYLLTAATALYSAGLSRDEILSVLTEPKTFLGACAYDHAKTTSRKRAAQWLWKYTVRKVLEERDASNIFSPVTGNEVSVTLSPEEQAKQDAEFEGELDWRKDIVRGGKEGMGPPVQSIENVVLILRNAVAQDLVRRNEFALRDTYSCDAPWGSKKDSVIADDDIPRIIHWLGKRWRFEPSDRVVYGALTVIACDNSYDPVRDYLDVLPVWDETPRLGSWLADHFGAEGDPEYLDQVFTKWMAAMVRRIYEPGAKFDWMPIFEGNQGAGKSSIGKILVGEKYFLDWLPNLADKDSALGLQGHWAVEMAELSNFRRNELETIKAFVTRTVDKFRPPHGRKLLDSPRRCVFFGTTNRKTYLIDDTGNRRFKPLVVGKLNFEQLRQDREQLLAEALHLYRTKYKTDLSYELTGNARIFEAKIHAEKMLEDESTVMLEAMQDFVEKVRRGGAEFDFKKFRILELFQGVGPLQKWQQNTRNFMFASKMLKKFGGEKRMIKGLLYWKMDEGGTSDEVGHTLNFC